MTKLSLKCPLYYPIPYGCYCGANLKEYHPYQKPQDEFDAICLNHDNCYGAAEKAQGCTIADEYLMGYNWKIDKVLYIFKDNWHFMLKCVFRIIILCVRKQNMHVKNSFVNATKP